MKEERNFSNNLMNTTKTFVKKEKNFMRTEKDLNSSNPISNKNPNFKKKGENKPMKKWERESDALQIADVVAMNLSEEEKNSIMESQSQIVVNTHDKILIDRNMKRNKKDCKVNRKIQAEANAEAKYKNCKAPVAVAKEGMLVFDDAIVKDTLPGAKFKVEVAGNIIVCYLNGKLRQNKIKIGKGDSVRVEMSTYGLNEGRITWRF